MEIPRTLLVTNDYPPRVGGIQRTLHALVRELPPERVTVLGPAAEGAERFDGGEPYRIVRGARRFAWPTPVARRSVERAIELSGAEVVLFGATYPLGLLGPGLARRGISYLCAAHGFEYWLSLAPGAHALMRRATSRASRVAVMCSAFVARVVRTAVPRGVPVSVLYPGADLERFRPDLPTEEVRVRHGLADRPLVVCVSRLVPRKGQDVLIRAMAQVRRRVPDACLLIVGEGPYRGALERLAAEAPPGSVVFAGQVSEEELPRYYAAADLFAMPCRTRLGGLEVEGWGNVFIEAAACGRPVLAGDSGGAREALVDGVTGLLVDGSDVGAVADGLVSILADPELARRMGRAGRERVERDYTWRRAAEQLAGWLREARPQAG
ncbi:MAG TPA: glycosyltransferase family 4 protein [Actinomycetota bacterium]|nr:glycosyltransferase family 4 protein [Actinomycetota bacterium]